MYNGYDVLRWVIFGTVTIVMVVALPSVFMNLLGGLDDLPVDRAAAEPAKPVDWNPLIIVGAVIVAAVFLAALIFLAVKLAGKKKRSAQAAQALAAANTRAWKDVLARHDAVKDHYYQYAVEDLDLILRFPALQDTSEKFVETFLQKFYAANDCRPAAVDSSKDPAGTQYITVVGELERAWERALSEASRIASSHLSQEDRKRLKTARKHWAVVNDESATAAERSLHARQLQKCLDGLINLDDKPQTTIALENAIRPALEAQAPASARVHENRGPSSFGARKKTVVTEK